MDWMQEEPLLEKAIWMEDSGGRYERRAEEENMEQTKWKRLQSAASQTTLLARHHLF